MNTNHRPFRLVTNIKVETHNGVEEQVVYHEPQETAQACKAQYDDFLRDKINSTEYRSFHGEVHHLGWRQFAKCPEIV